MMRITIGSTVSLARRVSYRDALSNLIDFEPGTTGQVVAQGHLKSPSWILSFANYSGTFEVEEDALRVLDSTELPHSEIDKATMQANRLSLPDPVISTLKAVLGAPSS